MRWIDVDILSEAFVIFYGGILDILVLNFGILSQNIHHCRWYSLRYMPTYIVLPGSSCTIIVIQNLRYEKRNKNNCTTLWGNKMAKIWLYDTALCSKILSLSWKMSKSPFLAVTSICLAVYLYVRFHNNLKIKKSHSLVTLHFIYFPLLPRFHVGT